MKRKRVREDLLESLRDGVESLLLSLPERTSLRRSIFSHFFKNMSASEAASLFPETVEYETVKKYRRQGGSVPSLEELIKKNKTSRKQSLNQRIKEGKARVWLQEETGRTLSGRERRFFVTHLSKNQLFERYIALHVEAGWDTKDLVSRKVFAVLMDEVEVHRRGSDGLDTFYCGNCLELRAQIKEEEDNLNRQTILKNLERRLKAHRTLAVDLRSALKQREEEMKILPGKKKCSHHRRLLPSPDRRTRHDARLLCFSHSAIRE